jgi:hypothetical protein
MASKLEATSTWHPTPSTYLMALKHAKTDRKEEGGQFRFRTELGGQKFDNLAH